MRTALFLRAPSSLVEPLVALSIAGVAAENLLASRVRPHRLVLVIGFGLVHGLGFGGALAAVLQSTAGLVPLLAANVGVEGAQMVVLCAAALAFRLIPDSAEIRTARILNVLLVLTGIGVGIFRLAA